MRKMSSYIADQDNIHCAGVSNADRAGIHPPYRRPLWQPQPSTVPVTLATGLSIATTGWWELAPPTTVNFDKLLHHIGELTIDRCVLSGQPLVGLQQLICDHHAYTWYGQQKWGVTGLASWWQLDCPTRSP